jgi:thioredoxin 1
MSKLQELINSDTPTLVDFFAEWCGPCKTMKPVLEELKQKVGDKATILKIDVDKNPAIASQFTIQSIPTIIIFKNGNVVWRQMGAVPATVLEKQLQQYYA